MNNPLSKPHIAENAYVNVSIVPPQLRTLQAAQAKSVQAITATVEAGVNRIDARIIKLQKTVFFSGLANSLLLGILIGYLILSRRKP